MSGGLRVFSFGGGVQSVAALVLAAQGRIDFREFLFANVGEDSEYPGTLAYLEQHARPYAEAHGLVIHEVRKRTRDGAPVDLLAHTVADKRGVRLPMRTADGRPGNRGCTGDWKIKPIAQWLKKRGATAEHPATAGMGISVDEAHRMRRESGFAWQVLEYPLIGLRFTRNDCRRVIQQSGLPLPPRSACWFCPFHTVPEWKALRRDDPALFERAADLEGDLSRRSVGIGRVPVYLTRYGAPLRDAIPDDGGQLSFLDEEATDACESGYCMT